MDYLKNEVCVNSWERLLIYLLRCQVVFDFTQALSLSLTKEELVFINFSC